MIHKEEEEKIEQFDRKKNKLKETLKRNMKQSRIKRRILQEEQQHKFEPMVFFFSIYLLI